MGSNSQPAVFKGIDASYEIGIHRLSSTIENTDSYPKLQLGTQEMGSNSQPAVFKGIDASYEIGIHQLSSSIENTDSYPELQLGTQEMGSASYPPVLKIRTPIPSSIKEHRKWDMLVIFQYRKYGLLSRALFWYTGNRIHQFSHSIENTDSYPELQLGTQEMGSASYPPVLKIRTPIRSSIQVHRKWDLLVILQY